MSDELNIAAGVGSDEVTEEVLGDEEVGEVPAEIAGEMEADLSAEEETPAQEETPAE